MTFAPVSTTSVGGVQVGTFPSVPQLANLVLAASASGYSPASTPVNTVTLADTSCATRRPVCAAWSSISVRERAPPR